MRCVLRSRVAGGFIVFGVPYMLRPARSNDKSHYRYRLLQPLFQSEYPTRTKPLARRTLRVRVSQLSCRTQQSLRGLPGQGKIAGANAKPKTSHQGMRLREYYGYQTGIQSP